MERWLEGDGLEDPKTWYLKTTTELLREAVDKVVVAGMIVHIRNE